MSEIKRTWLLILWVCLGAAILVLDYVTGPNIAIAYFFLIPVVLAAQYHGRFLGIAMAIVLSLIRFCFHFAWDDRLSRWDNVLNAIIRTVILVGAAILIDRVRRQTQEIRILRGILPICMFCKKIRTPEQQWQPIESYITKHSEAEFSHTFCPECGKKYYGDLLGRGEDTAAKPSGAPLPPR